MVGIGSGRSEEVEEDDGDGEDGGRYGMVSTEVTMVYTDRSAGVFGAMAGMAPTTIRMPGIGLPLMSCCGELEEEEEDNDDGARSCSARSTVSR